MSFSKLKASKGRRICIIFAPTLPYGLTIPILKKIIPLSDLFLFHWSNSFSAFAQVPGTPAHHAGSSSYQKGP